jgi:hypothetical protein
MPAQAPGDVRENDVAVVELDGEGRAREDLLNAAEDLDRRFLYICGYVGFGRPRPALFFAGSITNSDESRSFLLRLGYIITQD